MAHATTQTVALVTTIPQIANMSLASPPSDHGQGQGQDNETPFHPEAFLNMADRIKARSRKAVIFNQMAHAPGVAKPHQRRAASSSSGTRRSKPPSEGVISEISAQLLTSSPPETLRRSKRPSEDLVSDRPAQLRKVLQDEGATDSNPVERTTPAPQATAIATTVTSTPPEDTRPINDTDAYLAFANQVIKALEIRRKPRAKLFGDRQNKTILELLQTATPANDKEMLFLSGTEAAAMLRPGVFHDGPILTEGQQPMPLQRIEDFLGEYYDNETKVFVQDPSVPISGTHNFVREVTIGAVKKRLLQGKSKGRPWNCLELATHVEDGLRPAFLAGEDSRLLTKLKLEQQHAAESAAAGRRSYPQGYKEVEKWALLAERGALTEPHQDSHGYSTYITVNQGSVGFGWLSFPSADQRQRWNTHGDIAGDACRYVVLKPGQTVFFPAGTVHFVFRLPSSGAGAGDGGGGGHTLAFGGHVLRCSNIVHWAKTLLDEKASPAVTNEDLTSSAPGYLDRVARFVELARRDGTVAMERWGGGEAVEEFLRLRERFLAS